MNNRGSTLILTNLEGVHPRNIPTKYEANLCSGLREVKKVKSSRQQQQTQGITRVTLTHCFLQTFR